MRLLILAFLLLSVLGCQKPNDTRGILPPEVQLYSLYQPTKASSEGLTMEYRVKATQDLFETLRKEYAPWKFKPALIGVDVEAVAKSCIAAEAKIAVSSRTDYNDRLKICIAKFQDTHLTVQDTAEKPWVITLIGAAMLVENKWVISSVRDKLAIYWTSQRPDLEKQINDVLEIGNQIVSIDDIPANDYFAKIGEGISGSSRDYVLARAARRSFTRNSAYPTRPFIKVGFASDSGIVYLDLPWFYTTAEDAESNDLLSAKNLLRAEQINNATDTVSFSPYYRMFGTKELNDVFSYASVKDDEGDFIFAGRPKLFPNTCYIKISTFRAKNTVYAANGIEENRAAAIQKIIEMCELTTSRMVLDLQDNGGGSATNVDILLSHLLTQNNLYSLSAPRVSELTTVIFDGIIKNFPHFAPPYEQANATMREILRFDSTAVLPWIPRQYGRYRSNVTYTKPIQLITTSLCISACDEFVRAMKLANRATIIGTPTNGTGAGYIISEDLRSSFSDERKTFEIYIPNELFGVSTTIPQTSKLDAQYIMENKPTVPDVTYRFTLRDIREYYPDLIEFLKLN